MKFIYSTLLVLTISTGLLHAQNDLFSTSDDTAEDSYTQASIISEVEQATPGDIITIAIQLEHADGWHAYYQNPGGPGLPLEFDWQLPTGYALTQLYWPTPELYQSEDVQFYIYKERYTMLADISVPSTAKAGDQAKISVTPTWQLCDDKGCAPPMSKELMVTIPIGESQILSTEHESQFHLARSQLPESNQSWNIEAKIKAADLVLTISSSDGSVAILDSIYYIDNAGITNSSKAQAVNDRGDAYILIAPLNLDADPGSQLEGILIFDGNEAVTISIPLSNPAAEAVATPSALSPTATSPLGHGPSNAAPTAAEITAAAELYDAEQKIDFVLLDGTKEKAHNLCRKNSTITPCNFQTLSHRERKYYRILFQRHER